jgi:deoxyadenosine/deoxycytidine kinase
MTWRSRRLETPDRDASAAPASGVASESARDPIRRPTVVEFVGPSGAGKTSLIKRLDMHDEASCPILLSSNMVMDRPGRRWMITNPTLTNVVTDFTVLPSFVSGMRRYEDFVRFAFARLQRYATTRFAQYNYMREVVRNVGMQEFARRASSSSAIVVDEGAVLTASHLFVYSRVPLAFDGLDDFAHLVPLPDVLVYVRAPVHVLVDRARRRRDRRRELRTDDRRELQRWMERALEVFDRVTSTARIRDRVLTLDLDDSPGRGDAAARAIISFITQARISSQGGEDADTFARGLDVGPGQGRTVGRESEVTNQPERSRG